MSFEGAVAREMRRFLDSAEAAEVLGTVGLLMTQNFAKSTDDVSERGVGHWWFRKESFVRSGNGRGGVIVLDALFFFEFEIFEGLYWWNGSS